VHLRVLLRQPPRHRDDLGQRELDDAAGVGERRVEHRHAALARGRQVDLVDADAERAHRDQIRRGRQDTLGDLRPRPDAEQVHAVDGLDELILTERTRQRLDLIALFGQPRRRVGMDVLDQQRPRHQHLHLSRVSWPWAGPG
jgi:hypothetical protein